jgi:hypothetical protein
VWRLKLALGAVLAVAVAALLHPAGFRTAVTDIALAAGSLLAAAVAGLVGWGVTAVCRHRANRRACALPAGSALQFPDPPPAAVPATAFDRLAAGSYAVPAGTMCSGGCGRPAAAAVSYGDGRPPGWFCRGCHADIAVSDARADGICDLPAPGPVPAAPDNTPGHADMSGFEFES